ncbi:MAG: hypothetical protein EXS36_11725 [Pedosphaera sp.]|nr:hypothetical protein [Pedosphaera sp.]
MGIQQIHLIALCHVRQIQALAGEFLVKKPDAACVSARGFRSKICDHRVGRKLRQQGAQKLEVYSFAFECKFQVREIVLARPVSPRIDFLCLRRCGVSLACAVGDAGFDMVGQTMEAMPLP